MGPVDEVAQEISAGLIALQKGGQEILDVSSRFIVRAGDRPVIVSLNDKCAASDARERGDGSWRLGCYDLFSVRNAHRKATLSSPQPSAPEKLCRMDRTLVLRGSESDPIPSKKGADAQFRDGDMHVGIARVGHAP